MWPLSLRKQENIETNSELTKDMSQRAKNSGRNIPLWFPPPPKLPSRRLGAQSGRHHSSTVVSTACPRVLTLRKQPFSRRKSHFCGEGTTQSDLAGTKRRDNRDIRGVPCDGWSFSPSASLCPPTLSPHNLLSHCLLIR